MKNLKLFFDIIFLVIIKESIELDMCLFAPQKKQDCTKNKLNEKNETCCYLEMDMNKISTSACVRVKKNKEEINKKIEVIQKSEKENLLENIHIDCDSLLFKSSFIMIIFIFVLLLI